MRCTTRPRRRHLFDIVVESCRLVKTSEGIRGVQIVTQDRPTYGDLLRYRKAAQEIHAGLTVSGQGVISIRSDDLPDCLDLVNGVLVKTEPGGH